MPRTQPDRSFQAAVPGFLAYLTERERSPNTVRGYKADLRAFATWYEVTMEAPLASLLEITAVELREWKREMLAQGQKPASVNRRLSALQSFEHWAADTGIIPGAPERPTSCRQQRAAPRWLDRKERLAFLRAVEHGSSRDRAIAVLFLNTGLRVAEMAVLLWTDIVISERKGTLLVRHGKGYKRRDVPLNDDARKALLSIGYATHARKDVPIWQGTRGPLTVEGLQRIIEIFGAAAKIERLSCHILRHTFCHDLIAAGVGIEKVASLAGHDSIETTRRYIEASAADLQDAVDQLSERKRA